MSETLLREQVTELLARFHRNSCYPEAMDGELFHWADRLIALIQKSALDQQIGDSSCDTKP